MARSEATIRADKRGLNNERKIDEVGELAEIGAALVARLDRPVRDDAALTLTKTGAAEKLGVSAGFFKSHVLPELRVIRRGARVLIPVSELERWIDRNAARTVE